jgi:hypothetical protein
MTASTLRGCAVLAIALVTFVSMRAHTVAEYLGGTSLLSNTDYIGQSFTTSATDNYQNIAFNFFSQSMSGPIGNPYAFGPGYLFSIPYTGLAGGGDKVGAPGFVGQTVGAGGFYTFAPGLVLLGGTQYYFYTSIVGAGAITTGGTYGGGTGYVASGGASTPQTFSGGVGSRNFRLTGTPVPDAGSSLLLLGLAVSGLLGWRRLILKAALLTNAGEDLPPPSANN